MPCELTAMPCTALRSAAAASNAALTACSVRFHQACGSCSTIVAESVMRPYSR